MDHRQSWQRLSDMRVYFRVRGHRRNIGDGPVVIPEGVFMKIPFRFIESAFDWALKFYIRITQIRADDTPAEEMAVTILVVCLGAVVIAIATWLGFEIITSSSIPELVHNR